VIDVLEEKLGYSFQGDRFQTGNNNYPFHKAMVYHDHEKVKTSRRRKISDEVDRQEGERDSCSGGNWDKGWGYRVGI
jgi:hypothetical protein